MRNSIYQNDKVFWFEWVILFLSMVVIATVIIHVEDLKGEKNETTQAPRKHVIEPQPASFSPLEKNDNK